MEVNYQIVEIKIAQAKARLAELSNISHQVVKGLNNKAFKLRYMINT